ncbi:MAG: LptF/LptG family permease [Luteibaculaceae bacterium]
MLKILDRYIIGKFLGTFFFILSMVTAIAIVFDISEKIDDFLRTNAPLDKIILEYYLNFVIYYGNLFSPILIFLSVILFTSKLAQQSEIITIISGGVSFNRFLRPYFIAATLLALISLGFNHYLLPKANKTRLNFEEIYIRNKFRIHDKNIHREVESGTIIYFESYSTDYNLGRKFSMEKWEDKELKYKILSDLAIWDTTTQTWTIERFYEKQILENGEIIRSGMQIKDTILPFVPKDLGVRPNVASSMITPELDAFINKEIMKGNSQVPFFLIEKHQRTSLPFATYVLVLIGVCLSGRKVRGGIGVNLALGVGIAIVYVFVMRVTSVAATNAGFDPLIAVWIPNIIFSVIAVYIYFKTPK